GTGGFGAGRYSVFLGAYNTDLPRGSRVPHEIGHGLGFMHEMQRADFSGPCSDPAKVSVSTLDTAPDRDSIMASTGYCQDNPSLSIWDAVGVRKLYGTRVPAFVPLVTWFGSANSDYVTGSTDAFLNNFRSSYVPSAANGWVFAQQMPGTVPLKRYQKGWPNTITITIADAAAQAAAASSGYQYVATEGYVYSSQQTGTIALNS